MSIPLDRLYHYIESVAQDIRQGNVLIYHFYPHGSKKIEDLRLLHMNYNGWANANILPQIYCYDQEPLDYNYYQTEPNKRHIDFFLEHKRLPPNNLRHRKFNIYNKCILLHSELNSSNVVQYQQDEFIPVYYWSHAIIALDWFRYAQYQQQTKKVKKLFLIYNRAWSGTREYRLKFIDMLIDNNLINSCQTSCNAIEPELQIHYSQHQFVDPQWIPNNRLENYIEPTTATSQHSADFVLNDYNETEVEVVLETLFDDSRNQLTEKSLRPIACGQPFLMLSSAGSLKYLQRYGFKTFSEIFDESYDSILDPKERMESVVKTMSTIANWTDIERTNNTIKLKEITDYNRQHFFSQEFFNMVVNELKENLTIGLTELEQTNTSTTFLLNRKHLATDPSCRNILTQTNTNRSREDIAFVIKKARNYYNRYLKTLNK